MPKHSLSEMLFCYRPLVTPKAEAAPVLKVTFAPQIGPMLFGKTKSLRITLQRAPLGCRSELKIGYGTRKNERKSFADRNPLNHGILRPRQVPSVIGIVSRAV